MSLLPILIATMVMIGVGVLGWRPPRALAVKLTSVVVSVMAFVALAVLVATATGFVLGPAQRGRLVAWCRVFPAHHEVGGLEGIGSLLVLGFIVVRLSLIAWRRRTARRGTQGRRLAIRADDRPLAYAAPGQPGCVVVSTGLLDVLNPQERHVVFAHERAHLVARHDRYILIAAVVDTVLPVLRPLTNHLRLSTEREADEAAVRAVGGDRHLVATAISKAALAQSSRPLPLPAFGGSCIVARVEALLGPAPARTDGGWATATTAIGALLAVGASLVQIVILTDLVLHICHG
ncbi:MAG: M56 family metallopeptidase [Acidimicrobiia bacterium]|nr:M56 family metallopeptidase [Acidimicrobiia bacterium]